MDKQFRGARFAALIGIASLGLSACTMSDLAGLADALSNPYGGAGGYSSYGAAPVYAPSSTTNYYTVNPAAPTPSLSATPRYAGIGAPPVRNPYAAPDRREHRNRWDHRRDRDRNGR